MVIEDVWEARLLLWILTMTSALHWLLVGEIGFRYIDI